MSEPKSITFTSRIKSLDFTSFKVEERKQEGVLSPEKITFEIGINITPNEQQKSVTIINPISIFSTESKKELLGSIQVKGEFIIENLEEIKVNNGVPGPVVATFIGITISAARGMLRVLSKGTSFESSIIPIVNPTEILKSFLSNQVSGPNK